MLETANMLPLAEEATRLMKALAHPERLMICCQLREGELSVSEIEGMLEIPQPRLSRELAKLRADDLVGTRRQSKSIYYHLKDCLLYTSPSPRDATLSRMPSSA